MDLSNPKARQSLWLWRLWSAPWVGMQQNTACPVHFLSCELTRAPCPGRIPHQSPLSPDKGAAGQEPFIPSSPGSCISKAELEGPYEGGSPSPKYLVWGVGRGEFAEDLWSPNLRQFHRLP